MGWKISPPRGMELCASSKIGKWSMNQTESFRTKETEEEESQFSTKLKKISLGPKQIPFSAILDVKNDLNIITQEIAMRAELQVSLYKEKTTDYSLKPISKIEKLLFTFGNEEKTYMDFLVFENFNQIIVEENPKISFSSKESTPPENDRKLKGKDLEEDKLKVEDSEEIETIKG
ncbi:hypothetical protein O181_006206 [Austropuccinia psidii MF-1]|uniref:Uncharacterized protein n=1 Tax=Austropuccinia psidii MF-1 TaxID=1389203 RepID=A0A9Q3BKE3_9BASI|nr:hypothetical protein [Austropuccinia psidii MF-1]